VGTSGEAFAAVPWGSCGEPNAGPDGIGIFGIDPSGKVSTLDDVLDASDTGFMQCLSLGGSPPSLLSFGIAGASHWMTTFYVNQCEYNAASSTMPSVGTQVTTSVFSNPAAYVEGDAAGNTFVDLYWSNLPSNAVFKYDTTGKEVWSVFGMPPQVRLGPEMVADGQGGVYVLASAAGAPFNFGCGFTNGGLLHLGASGQCLWNEPLPGGAPLRALPSGQLYVKGTFQGTLTLPGCAAMTSASSSYYVAQLDASGACLWSESIAASPDVQVYPDGDLLLTVPYSGTIDLGCGPLTSVGTKDLAVAHVSASGACAWSRSFGGAGATIAFDQASADATGGAAEAVTVTGSVDFGGGLVSGGALFRLDASGAFRWQYAPFTGYIGTDPCGAVIAGTQTGAGVVMKLAP